MYGAWCRKHRCNAYPVYYRPEGTGFHRCEKVRYCPGNDNDPHILIETRPWGYDDLRSVDINETDVLKS